MSHCAPLAPKFENCYDRSPRRDNLACLRHKHSHNQIHQLSSATLLRKPKRDPGLAKIPGSVFYAPSKFLLLSKVNPLSLTFTQTSHQAILYIDSIQHQFHRHSISKSKSHITKSISKCPVSSSSPIHQLTLHYTDSEIIIDPVSAILVVIVTIFSTPFSFSSY